MTQNIQPGERHRRHQKRPKNILSLSTEVYNENNATRPPQSVYSATYMYKEVKLHTTTQTKVRERSERSEVSDNIRIQQSGLVT